MKSETPNLTFLVPIRHPATVSDWGAVKRRLTETLASLAAQNSPNWNAVLVANYEADVPALPPKMRVVRTHMPPPAPLPENHTHEEHLESFRADKGRRVLKGLVAARPDGFVMTVDYDDFVSRRLAGLVAENPRANGWYVESGYIYDAGGYVLRYPHGFHDFCGTSFVIRADLLEIPATEADASETYIRQRLGSHRSIQRILAERGTPLESLPFPGAMYRIGYADAHSRSKGIWDTYLRRWELRKNPARYMRHLMRLRPLSGRLLDEFFAGNRGPRTS